jgi:hypothetical protein
MFRLGDDNSERRSAPVVTFVLIALNVLVFLVECISALGSMAELSNVG